MASGSGKLRLRQVALVARDKEETVSVFSQILGLQPVHGSGDLSPFGLPARGPMSEGGRKVLETLGVENLLFMAGSDVIEVMFPTRTDGATVGFMDRRGGDTGYMVILQADDIGHYADLARAEGVRIAHEAHFPKYHDIHLNPKDCGGALLSVARHLPDNVPGGSWYPAGEAWETLPRSARVEALLAVELRSPEPEALAARWGRLLGVPARPAGDGHAIALADGELRFKKAAEGIREGFYGIDIKVRDRAAIEQEAAALGRLLSAGLIRICGLDVRLVD